MSLYKVSSLSEVSYGTVRRMNQAMMMQDKETLKKILDPVLYPVGVNPVIRYEEATLIVRRMLFAAKRGFALDINY